MIPETYEKMLADAVQHMRAKKPNIPPDELFTYVSGQVYHQARIDCLDEYDSTEFRLALHMATARAMMPSMDEAGDNSPLNDEYLSQTSETAFDVAANGLLLAGHVLGFFYELGRLDFYNPLVFYAFAFLARYGNWRTLGLPPKIKTMLEIMRVDDYLEVYDKRKGQ